MLNTLHSVYKGDRGKYQPFLIKTRKHSLINGRTSPRQNEAKIRISLDVERVLKGSKSILEERNRVLLNSVRKNTT